MLIKQLFHSTDTTWLLHSYTLIATDYSILKIGFRLHTTGGFAGSGGIDNFSITSATGVSIPKSEAIFILFPNPFSDKLNITVSNKELSEIILYDITSRRLMQQQFTNAASLNTEQLAKGIYLYEVRNNSDKSGGVIKKGKVVKE